MCLISKKPQPAKSDTVAEGMEEPVQCARKCMGTGNRRESKRLFTGIKHSIFAYPIKPLFDFVSKYFDELDQIE